MFKTLTPIIGIIVAIGLFFTYIQPTFTEVKGLQDETAEYAKAIEQASALQKRIAELTNQKTSIPIANLERLEAFLPDRVNEVSVLIDIDALATRHHLKLGDIKVGEQVGTKAGGSTTQHPGTLVSGPATTPRAVGVPIAPGGLATGDKSALISGQYATLDIGFSVSGTYNDFRMFLADIERSLVLMEVTKITFAKSEGDAVPFTMSVRLYSLNSLGSPTTSVTPTTPTNTSAP